MKGCLLAIISFFIFFQNSYSQNTISGRVVDANDKLKLENATIMLLQAQDSILVSYGRTDALGKFNIKKPDSGSYLLVVSFPKYADFYQTIEGNESVSVGEIGLQSVAYLIEEVVVKRRAAITIKGDTTEYDASQFKMEKNANVEDLLKALPGITVDASGKITAQGKTVQKVLVDGEEFFGDDPTLVTRNLRSDMVDKVQVYEKKSEQAERTGVDDGERVQTINVQLREDAKNGVFGKALAGGGTDGYYMGQLMFNKFKGSQKISAYGLFGNNGTTSLSWEDADKYGGDSGVSFSEETGTYEQNTDAFSGQGVIGVPRAINSGINFSDKWKGEKHKLNVNYKYGQINSDGEEETIRSGIITDSTTVNKSIENQQHRLNIKYDLNLDSLNLFTIRANASKKMLSNNINTDAVSYDNLGNKSAVIDGLETSDDKIDNINFDLLYTHRFMKKGRSFTFNATAGKEELSGGGYLYNNLVDLIDVNSKLTDQRKDKKQNLSRLKGGVTYTEPLSTAFNLSLGYSIENFKNTSVIESYNKIGEDYTELDKEFSSNYDYNRLSSNYRIGLNYNSEKFRGSLTNNLNDDQLNQFNNYSGDRLKRNFFTYNPRLELGYNLSKNKRFNLRYSGTNNLPSLSQIQPVRNNSDQLNVYDGNANLKPSFTNSFNLFFVTFQVLSGNYTYAGISTTNTSNPISQNITRNGVINYYKWDNIIGKSNFSTSGYAGTSFKLINSISLVNEPQVSVSYFTNNNFFNGEANEVKSTSFSFNYIIKRETKTGLNFNIGLNPQYRKMISNLSPDQNNSGFVFLSDASLEYFISKTFKVYTKMNYSYEAPTAAFDQKIERFLITPGISKKFLKDESLTIDFMINDLLNDNVGYSRSQYNSIFTQRRYDTIRRYYMLKLSWDFNKMFTK